MSSKLNSFSITESASLGRQYPEKPHPYRDDFDRDRDRIIHCSAFRRLEGKTQVFTPGLDDYYRTRLTHSIEVAQIGRTIARTLGLNQSLAEAICLAHDLGHPPFGHAGETFLNELMADFGGFEHNQQSLRIVDLLEHPYPDFMGLNLMYETRLGLARHKSRYDKPATDDFSQLNCSLEGQIADIADRIAYNCHDLEDGMRAGLINTEQLKSVELCVRARQRINAEQIPDRTIQRTRTAKSIIDDLVSDCIESTIKNLENKKFNSLEDIYNEPMDVVIISKENDTLLCELEDFLLEHFYRHDSLIKTAENIKNWLGKLFDCLCKKPQLMPGYFQQLIVQYGTERVVCDYIAGMTDRYCLKSLEKITGP